MLFPHCQHSVYLPNNASHLINDFFEMSIFSGQLLHQLVVFVQSRAIRFAAFFFQFRFQVTVVLQGNQALDLELKQSVLIMETKNCCTVYYSSLELKIQTYSRCPKTELSVWQTQMCSVWTCLVQFVRFVRFKRLDRFINKGGHNFFLYTVNVWNLS